ncbi:hypothetical protein HPB51_004898 [Rhipicephalus microplus]|uniref:C2H2-type domain-containing protein n=1 Tax=Rhipicephalus microplus TaxID=6941 RepID=A0A9J6E5W4_RHIMP|nr:hypothetical protein HPB51_004898 [Rhipicephalus microplus]
MWLPKKEWDKLKKRPVAHNSHYWMEAKQRFRAALGKVSLGWMPPNRDEYKNVKLRKIKWTNDMKPPQGLRWKSWSAPAPAPAGRVHRPTISRVHKVMFSLPSMDEGEEEEDGDSVAAGEVAVCRRCGYVTRNQRVFLRHRMMHRDVRAFCCRYCPARFCLPESLFLHLQVHTESHPYTCSSCGVRTRLLLQLWRHELRSLAQRLCLCHRCGLICHIRENLRQHLLKVHKVSVSSAFDTKPFQVCPGPTGAGTAAITTVPFKQPTQSATGKPASKRPRKVAAKPKTEKTSACTAKAGKFAAPPSTKKAKKEANESKVSVQKAGGATSGGPEMQQECKVETGACGFERHRAHGKKDSSQGSSSRHADNVGIPNALGRGDARRNSAGCHSHGTGETEDAAHSHSEAQDLGLSRIDWTLKIIW